jgi:plasmid stability protein
MKTPIFINESGNVLVFESVEDAERYIEPIDVINEEYVGYDSAGRRLALRVTKENKINIRSAEHEPSHAAELKDVLTRFLALVGVSRDWLSTAPLKELVETMSEYRIK